MDLACSFCVLEQTQNCMILNDVEIGYYNREKIQHHVGRGEDKTQYEVFRYRLVRVNDCIQHPRAYDSANNKQ